MSEEEAYNILRLQQTLTFCSQSIVNGDIKQSEESISELVQFLDSISSVASNNELESENSAFQLLSHIYNYLISPSLDQSVTDALAFVLPKAIAKFASVSSRCSENAERIVHLFVSICSPRDMVPILCEAMTSSADGFNNSSYLTPLLGALAKAFEALQRRPFEQVKVALPVVVKVLEDMLSDAAEDEDTSSVAVNISILIAHSLKAICVKIDFKDEKLCALFGLYVLQITALISTSMGLDTSRCAPMMLELSHFLRHCGFTYLGLITGHEVDMVIDLLSQGVEDDCISCFSYARAGAALTVIWRDLSNKAGDTAKEDMESVKDELRNNQTKRWEALGMLKHIFSSSKLPWMLKRHAIDFLFCMMEGVSLKDHDEPFDYSVYSPSLYAALQAIQLVIVYASDTLLRKKSFDTLKMVLADLPPSLRFELLTALIRNSRLSSMIGLLLDCVKDIMHKDYHLKDSSPFWSFRALDFVELVLKPPEGGPPSLPEFTDAVSAALNLYRYILINESSGNTNYTQVLSKKKLQKAYREWLEPLRVLISGVIAEFHRPDNQLPSDTVCALYPLGEVLYRCIELVEINLKHHS